MTTITCPFIYSSPNNYMINILNFKSYIIRPKQDFKKITFNSNINTDPTYQKWN